jgi:hypothetical protein
MHYKDGTKAHLGDIVRGRGYNLKHDIQGVVVGLTAGQDQCGIHVATLTVHQPLGTQTAPFPTIYEEHGTCSEFELVHPSPTRPRPAIQI